MLSPTKDPANGDFQCNNAMELFKKCPSPALKAPRDAAVALVACIPANPIIDSATIAGPGFINIKISTAYLKTRLAAQLKDGCRPKTHIPTYPHVCVDFSSPNIAKDMHVGHLRSTIIGESVCRILEYTNHQVDRINHVGDWGTQFGMLIQFLKDKFPDVATAGMESVDIQDLTGFYKAAKAKFDEDAVFKKLAQENVVKLQSGDEECLMIWQVLCDVSRAEFVKVYSRLNIDVKECGESFYNKKIPPVIEELKGLNMVVNDNGAKCIFIGGKFTIPLMVQKSDGGFGYDSTDMAALSYRLRTLKADRLVYITDFTQTDHFHMCFEAAKRAGWWNQTSHRVDHIGFGVVQGEDGKRFKTRSGETVRLVDLLDESVIRMEKGLRERAAEGKGSIPENEIRYVRAQVRRQFTQAAAVTRRNPLPFTSILLFSCKINVTRLSRSEHNFSRSQLFSPVYTVTTSPHTTNSNMCS